jgi:GNAT superfamily N-acetyltransferase
MSADVVVASRLSASIAVRDAGTADHAAIREIVSSAYRQYRRELAPKAYTRYLADLLDLERHTSHGHLVVAEAGGRVLGSAAFYPDSSVQGFGWPPGWAGGRALAVHPAARGQGVASALLKTSERLARNHGAPVFAFHTGGFMSGAIALYEKFGYSRAPEFDVDLNAHYGAVGAPPAVAIAYCRHLIARPYRHWRATR